MAQWLEHPTRRRVVGSNPIWDSPDFSESAFLLEFTKYHGVVVSEEESALKAMLRRMDYQNEISSNNVIR